MARNRQCVLRIKKAMQGHLFWERPTLHIKEHPPPGEGAQTADHSAQEVKEVKTA